MSTFTVGRFSVEATDNADFTGSDKLQCKGEIVCSTLAEAKARRQQCLGLTANPWEAVFPVTNSEDPTLDGYYRVRNAQVTTIALSLVVFTFKFSLELELVAHSTMPRCEIFTAGIARAGKPGGVTEVYWSAVPSTATMYDRDGATTSAFTRTGPGGNAKVYTAAGYASAYASTRIPPGNWHDMSAYVKVDGYELVGSQADFAHNTTDWVLGNGLIELRGVGVTNGSGGSYLADIVFPNTAGTGWGTAKGLHFGYWNGSSFVSLFPAQVEAAQVTTHECRLVLSVAMAVSGGTQMADIGLRLRRGSFLLEVQYASANEQKFGLKIDGTPASTSFGSGVGLVTDADDADTNRTVIVSATTVTQDESLMYATAAAGKVDLGIGCERAGGSSAEPNRETDLRDQYMAAVSETVDFTAGVGIT